MADSQTDVFAAHRDDILARAEAVGWPEICLAEVGRVEGEAGWCVAVEAATPDELIILLGALTTEEREE